MTLTVMCDLDGVICDARHREYLIKADGWDAFHSACELDKPFPRMVELLNNLSLNYSILLVTGRNERYREKTMRWLIENEVKADNLLMRPDDDYSKSGDCKVNLVSGYFSVPETELNKFIAMVYDDHQGVIDRFNKLGVTAFQVYGGNLE